MRQHIYALKDMINKRSDALMLASEQAVVHLVFGWIFISCVHAHRDGDGATHSGNLLSPPY